METRKVNQAAKITSRTKKLSINSEEKKRLTDFFSLLIEIDRKKNITKTHGKQTK